MNRYWTRIGLGAVLVFVLGMTAMAAARKGKEKIERLIGTAASQLPLRLAGLTFRLDGRKVGDLTGVEVHRAGPADAGRVTVRVRLHDGDLLQTLRGCSLTVDDPEHLDERTGFLCAEPADLSSGDLVEFGAVAFEPGDLTRPLFVPRHTLDQWRQSEIRQLDASLTRDGHGGVLAQGRYDIADRKHGAQRGTFNLRADSQGAVLSVIDELGRALVNARADRHGFSLNLRDRRGRSLIRLLADSLGAALHVR